MKPPMKRVPAVLVDATLPVPASLMRLLAGLAPLFTAPSFRTFCGLARGFLAQTGRRTVCGMLAGTGLAHCWSHDRAHRFFSGARWCPAAASTWWPIRPTPAAS
jgi:DDE superfamily endonuclease